jgi:ectoine hydroxylase-related dioxygenase (phytanoyl-CoA dioxygenase family)
VAVESEAVGAEMPRGSALIYVGRTFHGAGANSTKSTRVALNIAYNSSFLKQECNTFVTATPVQVRRMQIPSLVSELLGYVGSDADFLKPQQQQKTVARL